jgi:anti-sigma regulatory factor (Ser/Thr protein kinase)
MGRGGSRVRAAEATVVLEAKTASILDYESFVDNLLFLTERDRCRLKLAGGEVFDNIVKHAAPLCDGRLIARAARRSGSASILLGFYFSSKSFDSVAAEAAGTDGAKPVFDPAHRRWRGMGMAMCRNLARRVSFRPGETMDRIYLEFDPA